MITLVLATSNSVLIFISLLFALFVWMILSTIISERHIYTNNIAPGEPWPPYVSVKPESVETKPEPVETITGYLVDPFSTIPFIFVEAQAIAVVDNRSIVRGIFEYSKEKTQLAVIKLIRSGSGFRIYDHPTITQGTWLPCR